MTQTATKAEKTEKRRRKQARSLDPRLVALVKYLARRAAERDYKALQDLSADQTDLPENTVSGNAGADS